MKKTYIIPAIEVEVCDLTDGIMLALSSATEADDALDALAPEETITDLDLEALEF